MHELSFAEAVLPPQTVCLGVRLREYSLQHELVLLQQRNPLLFHPDYFDSLSADEQRVAVIRAVLVCENDWAKNSKLYQVQPWYEWLDGLWPRFELWLWSKTLRWQNIPLAIAEFRTYLAAAKTGFPSPTPDVDDILSKSCGYEPMAAMRGRPFGAPHLARLIHFVTENGRFSAYGYRSPYDFPYALAELLYATVLETEGAMRIENFKECEEREHIAAVNAQVDAERAARVAAGLPELETVEEANHAPTGNDNFHVVPNNEQQGKAPVAPE